MLIMHSTRNTQPGLLNIALMVIHFILGADWLQGPHVYALFSSYGMTSKQINQLFVVGFGSSMMFGTFVGSFADKMWVSIIFPFFPE